MPTFRIELEVLEKRVVIVSGETLEKAVATVELGFINGSTIQKDVYVSIRQARKVWKSRHEMKQGLKTVFSGCKMKQGV